MERHNPSVAKRAVLRYQPAIVFGWTADYRSAVMSSDTLQQFVILRATLIQEKRESEERLRQLTLALGQLPAEAPADPEVRRPSVHPFERKRQRRPNPGRKALKQVVIEVLSDGPLSKEAILEAVKGAGYKFATSNPMNSLGVILYGGSPKFRRIDGKFSLPKGMVSAADGDGAVSDRPHPAIPRKRKMSAAGRKAIAEAQKRRWAAAKAGS